MTILQYIKDNKQLLVNTILSSNSKNEIFEKLNCYRNSFNIKKLNEFIKENNLILSNREIRNNKVKCKYCGKEYTCTGISYHEKYCKENPNKEINTGNKGTTKGYKVWNKGKTKNTDNRIKQYGETYTRKVKSGELIPYWKGKKHSKETLQKIKDSMNKFFEEHGNPGWNGIKISYPEKYFMSVFENNHIDLQYHLQVGRYQLDFYNQKLMKYVEIDGSQHYRTQEAIDRDKRRDEYLLERGWIGKRINWDKFIKMYPEEKNQIINEIKEFIKI